jgi:serine/threonine protein phosphatase PrpC
MIYAYGFSTIGSSHQKRGTVCQDANKIIRLNDGMIIAAVADGVGSCQYSDIASSMAVEISTEVCADEIKADGNCDLNTVIKKAFTKAEQEIDKYSLSKNHPLSEYDTTLTLAIYDGKTVVYGHCGDGGIIGLSQDGSYVKITTPQKNEGIYVIPLRAGEETWIIGKAEEEYAALLLATDGVYDIFFPYLLKGQAVDIYVPLIRYFLDNRILQATDDTIEDIAKEQERFINGENCASITDDKTFLVMINGDIQPALKDDDYYAEPDWDTLQEQWNKKAYPHLYEEPNDSETEEIIAEES